MSSNSFLKGHFTIFNYMYVARAWGCDLMYLSDTTRGVRFLGLAFHLVCVVRLRLWSSASTVCTKCRGAPLAL